MTQTTCNCQEKSSFGERLGKNSELISPNKVDCNLTTMTNVIEHLQLICEMTAEMESFANSLLGGFGIVNDEPDRTHTKIPPRQKLEVTVFDKMDNICSLIEENCTSVHNKLNKIKSLL